MALFSELILVLLSLAVVPSCAGSFKDDAGVVHTWTALKPKVVAWSFDAVTLYHFGMTTDQLVGSYGERSASGSNHGGYYHDGNKASHGAHGLTPYDPSAFPADPTAAERALLTSLVDLSPGCSSKNYYCAEFNWKIFSNIAKVDLVVEGVTASGISAEVRYNLTARGIPIIQINGAYDGRADRGTGMIEVVQRFEQLAIALGVPDVTLKSFPKKSALCAAVETFKSAAKKAQTAGVRALAAYLPYGGLGDKGEAGSFLGTVEVDPVLAMFEELGMPIMHNNDEKRTGLGTSVNWEYQVTADWSKGTMVANNITSKGSAKSPAVTCPVDFWLYDDRVTLDVTSAAFATAWPDKAIVKKQMSYWPANGKIFSYEHATEVLLLVAAPLGKATRLQTTHTTQCTPAGAGGYSGELHRVHGMKPGQYACYKPVSYSFCNAMGSRQGDAGVNGAQGLQGLQGATSAQGIAGQLGVMGPAGAKGEESGQVLSIIALVVSGISVLLVLIIAGTVMSKGKPSKQDDFISQKYGKSDATAEPSSV